MSLINNIINCLFPLFYDDQPPYDVVKWEEKEEKISNRIIFLSNASDTRDDDKDLPYDTK